MKNILILCTGNSCRSILAEALFNKLGQGRVKAFSAGSKPAGKVNPYALSLLQNKNFDTGSLSSKSWDLFSGADAPRIDFVFTVCGNAAGETCPVFSGPAIRGHWGISDPADVTGSAEDIAKAFEATFRLLELRISALLKQPFETLADGELKDLISTIGNMEGSA